MSTAQYAAKMWAEMPNKQHATHNTFADMCSLFGGKKTPATYYRDEWTFRDESKIAWNHDANPGHEVEIME